MKNFYRLIALQISSYLAVLVSSLSGVIGFSWDGESFWERLELLLSSQYFWWGLYYQVMVSIMQPLSFLLLTWFLIVVFITKSADQDLPRARNWFIRAIRSLYTPLAGLALYVLVIYLRGGASGEVPQELMVLQILIFMAISVVAVSITNRILRTKLETKNS